MANNMRLGWAVVRLLILKAGRNILGVVIVTFVLAFIYFMKLHGGSGSQKCKTCHRKSNGKAMCRTCTTINEKNHEYLKAMRSGNFDRADRLMAEIIRLESGK